MLADLQVPQCPMNMSLHHAWPATGSALLTLADAWVYFVRTSIHGLTPSGYFYVGAGALFLPLRADVVVCCWSCSNEHAG